ncbi:hypothetical protein [Spiroplasma endosymbiont of Stenodema calcarata]|uniref:hypothetical protein n=1 Tax=Spiroplasma endosymbiont of Stenodema calcarata TaxID=3139328 RepID=UPI003CCB5382
MDCIIFALILSGFIFQLIDKGSNQQISMIISYSVLIMSFYILIKFTITNFFYSNIFFIKIVLYKKKIVIENTEIEKNQVINFTPFWFLTFLILINVVSTIVINYQSSSIFKNNLFIAACISTLSSILLIPSFSAILNKITEIKKPVINNYTNLIKAQFMNFKNLFDDYEIVNNFEYISFKDVSLESKKGFFILDIIKSKKKDIKDFNNDIINIYDQIWKEYCIFLKDEKNIKSKKLKRKGFFFGKNFWSNFYQFFRIIVK